MSGKTRKTILIAVFVTFASRLYVDMSFIAEGFIAALSIAMMAIFIYSYEELSPLYICFFSGIFTPLCRLLIEYDSSRQPAENLRLVFPDMLP